MAKKKTIKRKTESLLIALQIDMRTNNIKAKIGNRQQNSKCGFCAERNETIDEINK